MDKETTPATYIKARVVVAYKGELLKSEEIRLRTFMNDAVLDRSVKRAALQLLGERQFREHNTEVARDVHNDRKAIKTEKELLEASRRDEVPHIMLVEGTFRNSYVLLPHEIDLSESAGSAYGHLVVHENESGEIIAADALKYMGEPPDVAQLAYTLEKEWEAVKVYPYPEEGFKEAFLFPLFPDELANLREQVDSYTKSTTPLYTATAAEIARIQCNEMVVRFQPPNGSVGATVLTVRDAGHPAEAALIAAKEEALIEAKEMPVLENWNLASIEVQVYDANEYTQPQNPHRAITPLYAENAERLIGALDCYEEARWISENAGTSLIDGGIAVRFDHISELHPNLQEEAREELVEAITEEPAVLGDEPENWQCAYEMMAVAHGKMRTSEVQAPETEQQLENTYRHLGEGRSGELWGQIEDKEAGLDLPDGTVASEFTFSPTVHKCERAPEQSDWER